MIFVHTILSQPFEKVKRFSDYEHEKINIFYKFVDKFKKHDTFYAKRLKFSSVESA